MSFTAATGRAAALRRWAYEPDRAVATQAAYAARMRRYFDKVDPDRVLSTAEREYRARALQRSDMILLAQRRRSTAR